MSANLDTYLYGMANSLTIEAEKLGFSPANPISMTIMGSTIQGELGVLKRNVLVSYTKPTVPSFGIALWLDVLNRWFWVSDPTVGTWTKANEYYELFTAALSISGSGSGSSSSGRAMLDPVATSSDLAALNVSNTADKTLIYVEGDLAIYAYDLQSSAAESATVIKPASGVGRWILVSSASASSANAILDGGTY
jgi:hypothetical protein